jgi:hypothetical protein
MKGSAKSNNQSTKRTVFVLYVILFLLSITTVSMIQFHLNTSTTYTLDIEYEQHTTTATSNSFDHDYRTILVNILVMADTYESTLSGIRVGNFPLWVDTSDWVSGETVTISGNLYSIQSETGNWRARRSWSTTEYENLYYSKELGILIQSNTDRMTLGSTGGFSGYDIDITTQYSNINGLVARVTGGNIAGNIAVLSGIFIEVLIVQWLYMRKHKSKT